MRWSYPGVRLRAATRKVYRPEGYMPLPRLDLAEHRKGTARDTALRSNPIGFGPVYRICTRIGALPLKTFEITDQATGARQEARTHPAHKLLRTFNPAPELTRPLMIAGTVLNMLTYNRAFWEKVRPGENRPPDELWPLPPQIVSPIRDPRELISHYEIRPVGAPMDSEPQTLAREDVIYFRLLPAPEDWADAMAPLEPLAILLGMGKDAIDAASEFYQTGDLHGGYVKVKNRLSEPARKRLEAQLDRDRRKRFKWPVMEEDASLESRGGGVSSDEVLMRGIDQAAKMAREAFGLPETWDRQQFYAEVVQPIADSIEQSLEKALFTEWPDAPAFAEFGFRDVLKGDPKDRIEAHARAILTMQETPDEARQDENRSALGGPAGVLWGPLNQVPLDDAPTDGEPRPKDSAGGMGGEEGRETGAPQAPQPVMSEPQEPTRLADFRRARVAQIRRRWGQLRERTVKGQAEALGRYLRGILNREAREIRRTITGRAAGMVGLPAFGELEDVVRQHSQEVADRLRGFMLQAGERSAEAAAKLLEAEAELADRVAEVLGIRAEQAAEFFGAGRVDALRGVLEKGLAESWTSRDLGAAVGSVYDQLELRYVDGIARTEIAFAHEQAALAAWSGAGVTEIEVVFGGGGCTSGICEEAAEGSPYRIGTEVGDVGWSFEGADAPPLHPNCTCFAVPFIEAELAAEVAS